MLDKRAVLETLKIDGVDTRELMLRLHRLLKGVSPSVEDIVYVRKYVHIAVAYLRSRSQAAAGRVPESLSPGCAPSVVSMQAAPEPAMPTDVSGSIRSLTLFCDKHGSTQELWSAVQNELCLKEITLKNSQLYQIGSKCTWARRYHYRHWYLNWPILTGHLCILHDRLQILCDVVSKFSVARPLVTKNISKDAIIKGLEENGGAAYMSQFRGAEKTEILDNLVLALIRPPSVLATSITRVNQVVRHFNRIPGQVLQISRVVESGCVTLWQPNFSGGFYLFSHDSSQNKTPCLDVDAKRWCLLLSSYLSMFISSAKNLLNDTISQVSVSAPSIASKVITDADIENSDFCDRGMNFLRYFSRTSSLSMDTSVTDKSSTVVNPCLKRRRIDGDGNNERVYFFLNESFTDSCHEMKSQVDIPWVDKILASAVSMNVKCKAFPNLRDTNSISTLIMCSNIGDTNESVLFLSCDSDGFPIHTSCYRKGALPCIAPLNTKNIYHSHLVEDCSTYQATLSTLIRLRGYISLDSERRTSFAELRVKAIAELIHVWLNKVNANI